MRTVVGVFPSRPEAEHVVRDLYAVGVPSDEVTLADSTRAEGHEWSQRNLAACGGLSAGWFMAWMIPIVARRTFPGAAAFGALVGGIAGLAAGFVALLAWPVHPILYGNAPLTVIAAAAVGMTFGAILAGVYSMGVTHEEIPLREEAVREHGVVVAAHVDTPRAASALQVMTDHGARNLRVDADAWKASGWHGTVLPDEPYPSDSTVRKHQPHG